MTRVNPLSDQLHFSCPMLLTSKILFTVKPKKYITHVCMNTCMESTPTHNLWFWPKRPPLAFSVAETSVAEMSGPKRPRPKCPWPKCPTFSQDTVAYGFSAQLISPIQLHVKRQNSSICNFFHDIACTFFCL